MSVSPRLITRLTTHGPFGLGLTGRGLGPARGTARRTGWDFSGMGLDGSGRTGVTGATLSWQPTNTRHKTSHAPKSLRGARGLGALPFELLGVLELFAISEVDVCGGILPLDGADGHR